MIYTPDNIGAGSLCFDAETGDLLRYVTRINTDACTVTRDYRPLRFNAAGDVLAYDTRFERIEVSRQEGGNAHLLRFDCYGRVA